MNFTLIEESIDYVPGNKCVSGFDVEICLSTNRIPSGNNYILYMMFAAIAFAFTPTILK
jgi:hypothetical protein